MVPWNNSVSNDEWRRALQSYFDKNEKRNIAQIITNIMHQRVRFDLDANYFTLSYRLEVSCLSKQSKIAKLILDKMVIFLILPFF